MDSHLTYRVSRDIDTTTFTTMQLQRSCNNSPLEAALARGQSCSTIQEHRMTNVEKDGVGYAGVTAGLLVWDGTWPFILMRRILKSLAMPVKCAKERVVE